MSTNKGWRPPPREYMPSSSTFIGTGGGAALAPVLVWVFSAFIHVDMPPMVAAALGAIIGNVVGYFFDGGRRCRSKRDDPRHVC